MKNVPIAPERSAAWERAAALVDGDLRRRGAAELTRRAYASDFAELAVWSTAHGIAPPAATYAEPRRYAAALAVWSTARGIERTEVASRELRRCAAALSERRLAATSVARKLAAIRAAFRTLLAHGELGHNPADLLPAPKRPERLPQALKA